MITNSIITTKYSSNKPEGTHIIGEEEYGGLLGREFHPTEPRENGMEKQTFSQQQVKVRNFVSLLQSL
jgi:hypothetical protein